MHVQDGNIRVRDVNHGELFAVFICPMTNEDYIPPSITLRIPDV